MTKIKAAITCFLFLALVSCRKEDTRWNSELLFPILKTNLGISSIVTDSLIKQNADNSLTLVYDQSFYQFNLDTLLDIPDTTVQTSYALPFGTISAAPGQPIISRSEETKYNLGDVSLSKIILKSGKVNFTIQSHIKGKTLVKFKLPLATLNGVPFEITNELPAASGSTPATYTSSFDLSGHNMDLTGMNHNKSNTIQTQIEVYISSSGDTTNVSSSDPITINYTFENVKASYAKGYFGSYQISIPATLQDFNLFNSIKKGTLSLDKVKLNLYIKNSVGIDARIKLKQFISVNSKTYNDVALQHTVIGSNMNINRAIENPFTSSYFSTEINQDNSNIKSVVENLPDKISYALDININPLGNVTNGNDFIYTDKTFEAGLKMEIPLCVSLNQLTLQDTISVSFADSGNFANRYKGGRLIIIADNHFPFSAEPRFYLLNELNQVSDSIIAIPGIIESAKAVNGIVTESKHSELSMSVDKEKLLKIIGAKNIIVKITFDMNTNPGYNTIYSNYGIDIKLAANPELELRYR